MSSEGVGYVILKPQQSDGRLVKQYLKLLLTN